PAPAPAGSRAPPPASPRGTSPPPRPAPCVCPRPPSVCARARLRLFPTPPPLPRAAPRDSSAPPWRLSAPQAPSPRALPRRPPPLPAIRSSPALPPGVRPCRSLRLSASSSSSSFSRRMIEQMFSESKIELAHDGRHLPPIGDPAPRRVPRACDGLPRHECAASDAGCKVRRRAGSLRVSPIFFFRGVGQFAHRFSRTLPFEYEQSGGR